MTPSLLILTFQAAPSHRIQAQYRRDDAPILALRPTSWVMSRRIEKSRDFMKRFQ